MDTDSAAYWNMEKIRIREATAKGYVEIKPGDVFDASYPESKTRRGRLQGGARFALR